MKINCLYDFALKRVWSIEVSIRMKTKVFSYRLEHLKYSEEVGLTQQFRQEMKFKKIFVGALQKLSDP